MSSSFAYHRTTPIMAGPSTAALYRALSCSRVEKRRLCHARYLWWWSRHSTWSTPNDEYIEDRMQKYQKTMRYRYSRALKRRAMWERDNSPPQWALRGPSKWFPSAWVAKPLSTTDSSRARLKDEESDPARGYEHWNKAQQDFEAFKAEIDRAIAKDPVGFLFGRRLQGPPSSNNSSWTSFARMFDSKESKATFENEDELVSRSNPKRIKIESLDSNTVRSKEKSSVEPVNAPAKTQLQSSPEPTYVFDPISGRNVIKENDESHSSKSFAERMLGNLFAEHGASEKTHPPQTQKSLKADVEPRFKNSREYEYSQLRSSSLGNNLDTTAEFGGKYYDQPCPEKTTVKSDGRASAISDDTPPFTGTTYESSHVTPSDIPSPSSSWLESEGFRNQSSSNKDAGVADRLQSSLDRMQSETQATSKKFITKLQPAVDRISFPKPKFENAHKTAPLNIQNCEGKGSPRSSADELAVDTREDLDLLRPSDIRAATRSARVTKDEIYREKEETRKRLEEAFASSANETTEDQSWVGASSARLQKTLSNSNAKSITKHMQRYPNGIVAKTLQIVDDISIKSKLYPTTQSSTATLTQVTKNSEKAPARLPYSYTDRRATTVSTPKTTTEEILAAQKAREALTKTVRELHENSKANASLEARSFSDLAKALLEAFESEKGPIELKPVVDKPEGKASMHISQRPDYLKTATVKPGGPRYPAIERHTQEFEPRLIELREKAKEVKRSLHDISSVLQQMQYQKPAARAVHLSESRDVKLGEASKTKSTSMRKEGICSTDTTKRQLASYEKQRLSAMRALNDRIKREPHLLEKPVLRPRRAEPAVMGGQMNETMIQETDKTSAMPTSPYVLLTYNKQTGEVDATELDNLLGDGKFDAEKVNPIVLMSNLNYPAAFVSQFVTLEKAGYSLITGGDDLLILQKSPAKTDIDRVRTDAFESIRAIKSDIKGIRNKIAEEEAKNQPQTHVKIPETKTAATVLDEIPVTVPRPGPAAPTAPPAASVSQSDWNDTVQHRKNGKQARRVRRQEQVFSGTIRPATANARMDSTHEQSGQSWSASNDQPGFLQRVGRTLRKVILTTIGLAAGAYTIGIVAEGIGAHAQAAQGTAGGLNEAGPRKKVVMPVGQRPGIYSTESSRNA